MKNYPIRIDDIVDKNYEHEIINQKYDFIEEVIDEVLMNRAQKEARTEKIDQWMTHPVWGMPIFFGIMALVFLLTFAVGDWIAGGFEIFISGVANGIQYGMELLHLSPTLISLVCDGIISGVGGILTFLPNIFMLFLGAGLFRGQRLYVPGGLCDGRADGKDGVVRPGVYPDASRIRLYRAGDHECKNAGRYAGPAENDHGYTVYVLQRETPGICIVFKNVLRKICHGCSIFHVCGRPGYGDHRCVDLQQDCVPEGRKKLSFN